MVILFNFYDKFISIINLISGIHDVHGVLLGPDTANNDELIAFRLSGIYVPGLTNCTKTPLIRTCMTNVIALPFANFNIAGPTKV